MKPGKRRLARRRPAVALALALMVAGAGCDRFQQQAPIPTYPDTKLDAMRAVTGAELPHDPHGPVVRDAAPPAASATASAAARER